MRWDDAISEWTERARGSTRGLAGQILALAVAATIAAEVLLLPPALGNFHDSWLHDRLDGAYNAALIAEASPAPNINDILDVAIANEIIVRRVGAPTLHLSSQTRPDARVRVVDLRKVRVLRPMADGISVLMRRRREYLRVIGTPWWSPDVLVEVVVREEELKTDIFWFARRTVLETLIASTAIGACLYAAFILLVVRRVRRMTGAIEAFGKRPQEATAAGPAVRDDELGRAEQALGRMREEVRAALLQKERLAGLGTAVAKIVHDLRNSLATAQLVSERLAGSDDPRVRQATPRLARAIARAIALAEGALQFGKPAEPRVALETVDVRAALEEAADEALAREAGVAWRNDAPPLNARADPDALHRILSNLIRNAAEAMRTSAERRIVASASAQEDGAVYIEIADCGPGVSMELRERLFEPFASHRDSGVGLGLAIARDLARAQGGEVTLVDTMEPGARFRVSLEGTCSRDVS